MGRTEGQRTAVRQGQGGPGSGASRHERHTDLLALGCCCCKYRAKTSSPVLQAWSGEGSGLPGACWLLGQSRSHSVWGGTEDS